MAQAPFTIDELRKRARIEEGAANSTNAGKATRVRARKLAAILRELIERRERDELDARAHSLAYESCLGMIESDSACPLYDWHDCSHMGEAYAAEEHVAYLDARGLIQRDPEHPGWIAVLEESEATR